MKLLVIGIDGGDQEIIEAMDMPFTKSFFKENVVHPVLEDLLDRGWAKVLSGVPASINGGLYMRPMLDGTVAMTQSYNAESLVQNPDVKALWTKLNEGGQKVGIFNVPITNPCPKVDGFFVAGGGGGVSSASDLDPSVIVFPESIAKTLAEDDFKFDLRLSLGEVKTTAELVKELNDMAESRTKIFGKLCQEFPVDFGFICFRPPTEIQYLARKDIDDIITGGQGIRPEFRDEILDCYRVLDKSIEDAVKASGADHIMFVSDHGTAPYRYRMCLNSWLEQQGFLKRGIGDKGLKKHAIKLAKMWLPKGLKKNLKKGGPAYLKNNLSAFDAKRTQAFAPDRILGIYLNDERFTGLVDSSEQRAELQAEIIGKINQDPAFKKMGLTAVPFRDDAADGPYKDTFPDIGFQGQVEVWPVEYGPLFCENPNYKNLPESIVGLKNPNAGVRGAKPLLVSDAEIAKLVQADDKMDLTLAYKLIVRAFGIQA